TILTSKIMLVAVGFILFALTSYFTLFWIRHAYLKQFHASKLPSIVSNRKISNGMIIFVSFIMGVIGSSIVQGIGWERSLKLLNQESYGITDPFFGMDVSFYVFTLPFINFVIYVLLSLAIFYLMIEFAAYAFFNMYRENRTAQLHLGVTLAFIGLLLAGQHL